MAYLTEWLLPDTRNTDTSPYARWAIRQTSKGADVRASTEESSLATEAQYATAFSLAYGTKLSFYEWQTLPENSARLERFGHAMRGTRQWETTGEVLQGMWAFLTRHGVC